MPMRQSPMLLLMQQHDQYQCRLGLTIAHRHKATPSHLQQLCIYMGPLEAMSRCPV